MENIDYSQYRPDTFEYNGKWIKNWFSNMIPDIIHVDGSDWPSVENYYQAMKCKSILDIDQFLTCTPSKAKQLGRKVQIREDWECIKYDVMIHALEVKFSKPEWKEKLLATGDDMIIEWNNWGDKIWGVTINDNQGKNLLGKALMGIRRKLNGKY